MSYTKQADFASMNAQQIVNALAANDEVLRALLAADNNRMILNGDFAIDQPNEGAAVIASAGTVYGPDGSKGIAAGGGAFSMQKFATGGPQLATGCIPSFLRLKTTTADAALAGSDRYRVHLPIEGLRWKRLGYGAAGALTARLSKFMRTSRSGGAQIPVGVQNSASDRTYPALLTISAQNVWERPLLTFVGDTGGTWLADTGIGAKLIISLGAASSFFTTAGAWAAGDYDGASGAAAAVIATLNETLDITGVHINPGEIEPALYVPPDPTLELIRCMREYEKTFPQGVAPAQSAGVYFQFAQTAAAAAPSRGHTWQYKTPKRSSASITTYNPSAANANARNVTRTNDAALTGGTDITSGATFTITGSSGSAVGDANAINIVADARL